MDDFEFDFDFEGNPIYEFGAEDFSNLFGDIDELMNFDVGGLDLSGLGNFSEDIEQQAGGFYGNMPGTAVYDPRTNTTELYNPSTDTMNIISHGGTTSEIFPDFDESEFTRILGDDEGAGTIEIVGKSEDDIADDLASDFWKNLENKNLTNILTDEEHTRIFDTDGSKTSILTDEEHTRTGGDDEPCKPGTEKVQKFADGSTLTLDCKGRVIGSTKATTNPDDPEDCPAGTEKRIPQPDGRVMVLDCKDRFIRMEDGKTVETGTPKKPIVTTPKTPDDLAKWIALLGGLMGLLGQNKPSGPAGYQGGIPKYTATRGPSRSPTAGGRRPGAAGIGSLTGGVSFTPVGAARGGLMGLAAGGQARPARYLAGGTDGMADKIQTSIDGKQPARLSHGEFVIPADVVSHLGNGNSDAGADVLYDMMAKVRKARTGNPKQGKQINPRKYTPV
jgi:hypothetical protein